MCIAGYCLKYSFNIVFFFYYIGNHLALSKGDLIGEVTILLTSEVTVYQGVTVRERSPDITTTPSLHTSVVLLAECTTHILFTLDAFTRDQ